MTAANMYSDFSGFRWGPFDKVFNRSGSTLLVGLLLSGLSQCCRIL